MSAISEISSSRAQRGKHQATQQGREGEADTDMAGGLVVGGFVTVDLDQPALHDRAGGDVDPATSDGASYRGRPQLRYSTMRS